MCFYRLKINTTLEKNENSTKKHKVLAKTPEKNIGTDKKVVNNVGKNR